MSERSHLPPSARNPDSTVARTAFPVRDPGARGPSPGDSRRVVRGKTAIGVIAFNVWMTPISRQFDEAVDALRDAAGIVIDLRGNPGGVLTMIMGLSGHFVDSPLTLGTITTRDSSLKLIANPRTVGVNGQPVKPFAGP